MRGAPPDFNNFEIADVERFTPPLGMNNLHFSPSISSLLRPSGHLNQFPVWRQPPLSESSFQDPVPTKESKSYVPMKALPLIENRETNHSEFPTSTLDSTPEKLHNDIITLGQPLSIDNSEWSLSTAVTDSRCQTFV